jgi:hypothetical protein
VIVVKVRGDSCGGGVRRAGAAEARMPLFRKLGRMVRRAVGSVCSVSVFYSATD